MDNEPAETCQLVTPGNRTKIPVQQPAFLLGSLLLPCYPTPQRCTVCPGTVHKPAWKAVPPAAPVLCRVNTGKRFLCSLFVCDDKNFRHGDADNCTLDDTVELVGDEINNDAYTTLERIDAIDGNVCCFERVALDVFIDCSRMQFDLFQDQRQLAEFIKGTLMVLFFCEGCNIHFATRQKTSFGVDGVYVREAEGSTKYGRTTATTFVEIRRLMFHKMGTAHRTVPLGGLAETRVELTAAFDAQCTPGILLTGPPGSGKRSLVKQEVARRNLPMFEIRGLSFLRSLPGETEAELRQLFQQMENCNRLVGPGSRSVLLVKDIDALCPKLGNRKGEDVAHISRISSQFVTLVDRYRDERCCVSVIGTTSAIGNLDNRVRRPGRFETEINLRMPTERQRKEILLALDNGSATLGESSLAEIARHTPGFVGADLELLFHFILRESVKTPPMPFDDILTAALQKHRPASLRGTIGLVTDLTGDIDSLGGMGALKSFLRLSVMRQLKNPAAFRRLGVHPLKGVLLYGPPGCAKTSIAKCLAAEAAMTFFSLSAAEIYSPFVGNAEKLITQVFHQARTNAPAVIFLDEIDSLVGTRSSSGTKGTDVQERVLSTLLTEMDGIGQLEQAASALHEESKHVLIVAATNRPDMIDDALLRPGRLTKLIHVQAPDVPSRYEILTKVTQKIPLAGDVDLMELASRTDRFSGADLQSLCTQAALHAAALDMEVEQVTMAHFDHVLSELTPSLTKGQIDWYHDFERRGRAFDPQLSDGNRSTSIP